MLDAEDAPAIQLNHIKNNLRLIDIFNLICCIEYIVMMKKMKKAMKNKILFNLTNVKAGFTRNNLLYFSLHE